MFEIIKYSLHIDWNINALKYTFQPTGKRLGTLPTVKVTNKWMIVGWKAPIRNV